MEDVPPSYQSAIDREAWNVIAPWIPSSDLCSACLVSQKWHSIFVPFLWGDPARHFGIQNDAVFVALTRFKRTLRKARASVRGLTHTLHLPPALSEIYGGPNREWLRDVLDYLPNLQSLIVSKLPFFDHHSLLALRAVSSSRLKSSDGKEEEIPVYGLKLLLAAYQKNATSTSIASALPCFQALVYLDLSYTTPAKDAAVLSSLSNLFDLQVLKLRGIGLRDGEAEVLANSIGIRVRLLDIRENLLTDMAVRSLMQACFMPPEAHRSRARPNSRDVEDWPVGIAPGPDYFSLDTLRSEELDYELLKQLTNPLTGRLAFEDIPHRGLTHLYISENNLSVEGLASLLKSERLHVLDGGSVDSVKIINRSRSLSSPTGYTDEIRFPGAEKLIPVLAKSAAKNLTYLRVDHAVITEKLEVSEDSMRPRKSVTELQGTLPSATELPSEERHIVEAPAAAHYPLEMPSEQEPRYELDATPAEPRYELIGDIMQFAISPPIGDKPEEQHTQTEATVTPIRGEGAYAPEVVTNGNVHASDEPDEEEVVLNASGSGMTSKKSQATISPKSNSTVKSPMSPGTPNVVSPVPKSPFVPTHRPSSSTIHRQARIDMLLRKRPPLFFVPTPSDPTTRTISRPLSYLHPSALPNLRTLILSGVPTSVPMSSPVLPALKSFISACADEAALSTLCAQINYSLPPGRTRHAAEVNHARSLFALRLLVLEMVEPGSQSARSASDSRGWHNNKQRVSMSKSSTGDHDSENLWSAASNDFSFFGEEGEEVDECGIYENEPDKYFPTAHMDDKILLTPQDSMEDVGRVHSNSVGGVGIGTLRKSSPTVLRSPRELPLGRNRRRSSGSGEFERDRDTLQSLQRDRLFGSIGSARAEMMGSSPSTPTPMALSPPTSNPMQMQFAQQQQQQGRSTPSEPDEPMVDVKDELAKWRRGRKKAFEDAVVRWKLSHQSNGYGNRDKGIDVIVNGNANSAEVIHEKDMPFVEGYWEGEIRVVKNAAPKGRTGIVDMYGNYFEKGYLYP